MFLDAFYKKFKHSAVGFKKNFKHWIMRLQTVEAKKIIAKNRIIAKVIWYSTRAQKRVPIMRKRSVHLKPNIDLLS